MDFTITPNTTPAQIQSAIGKTEREELRESMERREHLEKLATMHAGEEVYVQISGTQAYADIASRKSRMGFTDRVIINVPAETPDQVVTNMSDEAWDLLFQKTEMYHELGHVLYTDWPSFEECLFGDDHGNLGVPEADRPFFKDLWNTIEDATIERLLAQRFNIEDDLRIKNENILRQQSMQKMTSLRQAISMAVMEYKHPIGWVDTLLDDTKDEIQFLTSNDRQIFEDEVHPIIERMVPQIVQEGTPEVRNRMVYGLYKQLIPFLDDADAPGDEEETFEFGFSDDGDEMGTETPGQDVDTDADPDDIEPPEMPEIETGIKQDVQRDYQDQVDQQKEKNDPSQKQDSMEEWVRVMQRDYDVDSDMKLKVPSDPPDKGSYDDATRAEAERLSGPIAKELRERLKREQRTQKQKKQSSGKVDPSSVHKTQKGKTNVFTRHSEPDEKDYACMIIVDRSGSMDNGADMMPDVEQAAGSLAYALEDIGVDVGQVSLTNGDIHLEKDLSESVREARRKMFRGYNGGGTPLSDALALARARLESRGGHPFVIVLTDGEPDHRERYRDHLHKCDFPVLGIYVDSRGEFGEDHMNESSYFHHLEVRKYDEAFKGVRNMVKKVMF